MNKKIVIFILITLLSNSFCYAEMYIWVDKNGLKHFSDIPPDESEVPPDQVKQDETASYVFNHRLYKKAGNIEYCGDWKLPDRTEKNYNELLIKVQLVHENAIKYRKRALREIKLAYSEEIREAEQNDIDENECASEWAISVLKELQYNAPSRQAKQTETLASGFYHRFYKKAGNVEYCGNRRLPDRKNESPEQLLEKMKRVYRKAKHNRQISKGSLSSDYGESYSEYQKDFYDEYTCIMEWSTAVIKKLEQSKP